MFILGTELIITCTRPHIVSWLTLFQPVLMLLVCCCCCCFHFVKEKSATYIRTTLCFIPFFGMGLIALAISTTVYMVRSPYSFEFLWTSENCGMSYSLLFGLILSYVFCFITSVPTFRIFCLYCCKD